MRICAALVLLALALASCGGSGSKSTTTVTSSPGLTGSAGPTGSTAPKPAPRQRTHAGAPRPKPGSNVKVSFLQQSMFGAKSQIVYFVAKGRGTPLAQAKRCVRSNLRFAPSAYCFAFSSERAFRFSRVAPRPPAKMGRPCWTAYWGKPSGRRAIGSSHNPAAVSLHCPDRTS